VQLPKAAPDRICSVVVLNIAGEPEVESRLQTQAADGSIRLEAVDAIIHGSQARYESGPQRDNIGFWMDPKDWVEWPFTVSRPGKFTVTCEIASMGTGSFQVLIGNQILRATAPQTGDYGKFRNISLGTVEINAAGKTSLAVKPIAVGWSPINLQSVKLEAAR
jgi:hypothetical protein